MLYKSIYIQHFDKIQKELLQLSEKVLLTHKTGSTIVEHNLLLDSSLLLTEYLADNNLKLDVARFFVIEPNDSIGIHIDGSKDHPKFLALNIPILNCQNTYMQWWDNLKKIGLQSDPRYMKDIVVYDETNKQLIGELELTTPCLVKIDTPHSVKNPQNVTRIVLSLRFNPEPLDLWHQHKFRL
jgi:hypothetical protein